MEPTFCEQCNRRTIDLFGGLCIDCDEGPPLQELPGASPPDSTSSP